MLGYAKLAALALLAPLAAHGFTCLPKEWAGSGLAYNVTSTAQGTTIQWMCSDGKGGGLVQNITWLTGETPISQCVAGWSEFAASAPAAPGSAADKQMDNCRTAVMVSGHYGEPTHEAVYQAGRTRTVALWQALQPPVGVQYVVTSVAAYPLNPDGSRSITPWPTKAVLGEPCDCDSVHISPFPGSLFCRIPSLSAGRIIVAGCSVKK